MTLHWDGEQVANDNFQFDLHIFLFAIVNDPMKNININQQHFYFFRCTFTSFLFKKKLVVLYCLQTAITEDLSDKFYFVPAFVIYSLKELVVLVKEFAVKYYCELSIKADRVKKDCSTS